MSEKINKIVDMATDLVLNELKSSGHDSLLAEMATFGYERWGNKEYKIAIHGIGSGDRSVPHIHIYAKKERNTKAPSFNFEISLMDILEYDQINLIAQKDIDKNIVIKNRSKCSWNGYAEILKGLKLFFQQENPESVFGKKVTNLERCIYEWNRETDYSKTMKGINVLGLFYDRDDVLPKYQHMLDDYVPQNENQ